MSARTDRTDPIGSKDLTDPRDGKDLKDPDSTGKRDSTTESLPKDVIRIGSRDVRAMTKTARREGKDALQTDRLEKEDPGPNALRENSGRGGIPLTDVLPTDLSDPSARSAANSGMLKRPKSPSATIPSSPPAHAMTILISSGTQRIWIPRKKTDALNGINKESSHLGSFHFFVW